LNLTLGQSDTVTAYSNNGSLYVYSNSNASVVSVSISGNVINIYGINNGSSSISICSNGSGQCATLYVTVGGGNNCYNNNCGNSTISLSQTSLSLNISQSATVAIYGTGGFYVSSNSNSSVVNATVAGTTLYLNSLSAGSSTISVCQVLGNSACATLYVTVSGTGSGNSSIWFSQSTVNLSIGQSRSVTIYSNNYGGNYYISSNPNSGMVNASIVGNQLNLYGQSSGYSTLSICQNSGGSNCGSIYVSVGGSTCGYNCGNGTLSLSQTSLSLSQGQSGSVNVYGNGSYYVSSNSNSAVASATINGGQVNVYAGSAGSTTISICQNNGSSQCASLYVTVGNNNCSYNCGTGTNNTVSILDDYFSPKTITITAGTSVTWTNHGLMQHTVTADDNSYNSNTLSPGQSFSHTFTSAGTYYYHCVFHGGVGGVGMSGIVIVTGSGGGVLGASTYQNGSLISENGTVSIVYQNIKTAFANASAFLGLGFKFSYVVPVGSSGLPSTGYTVTTSQGQHPWGSWIKDGGNTVYFVHQNGLIPLPDWNTFLNNGGQQNLIVTANSWDFKLTILSPMVNTDPRLQ
jgi:plastocyanin